MILREPLKYLGLSKDFSDSHKAIDLGYSSTHGGANPNILALAKGYVVDVFVTETAGNCIAIRYDDTDTTYYSVYKHCKKILKEKGEAVKSGEAVAIMGKTGTAATGNHLHFELYVCPIGTPFKYTATFIDEYVAIPYDFFFCNDDVVISTRAINKGKFTYLPTLHFSVGDIVRITGEGNSRASGTGTVAKGIGWKRKILAINEDAPYPYRVGNVFGTTGYYKEDALKLI